MLVLTARNLSDTHAIAHGFFGRQGGVSEGLYASLNCGVSGSNDARANVVEIAAAFSNASPAATQPGLLRFTKSIRRMR